jgi:hypothetical protein
MSSVAFRSSFKSALTEGLSFQSIASDPQNANLGNSSAFNWGEDAFAQLFPSEHVIDRDLMVTMGDNLCGLFDSRSGGPTRSWCSLF